MNLLRKRRLLMVLCVTGALGLCAGGLVAVRMRMIRQRFLAARDKGLVEYQHGDSVGTIRDLGMYLSAYPQDSAALEAYAESRLRIEMPDGSHLFGAIGAFRRLADLRPGSTDIQRRLVGLYAQANLNTECKIAVEKLLEKSPNDPSLLSSRATALLRLRKFKDALAATDDYLKVKPDDLQEQVLRLEILAHTGPPAPDLVAAAAKVRTAHPDDVRWKLLQSVACGMAGDVAGSKKWIAECEKTAAPDAQFARLRVLQLWQTGQVSLGDAALDAAVKQFDDGALHLLRVHRLYQTGQYDALSKLAPTDADVAKGRAILRGYQCLAAVALKDTKKAEAIRAQLAANVESLYARDWAAVLAYVVDPANSQSTSRTKIVKEVAQRHSDEAYFEMAEAANDVSGGDFRSAMRDWEAAARQEPAWAAPVTQVAQALLASGRAGDAVKVAQAALLRSPDDREALVTLALASALLGRTPGNNVDLKALLATVDDIDAKYPDEQRVLALRVSIKTQMLGKVGGSAALRETLEFQPPPSLQTLLQLAMVSRGAGLGLEAACFSSAEKLYGMARGLAFAEAITLSAAGKVGEGKKLLAENRQKATKDLLAWGVAYARYLEANHDPEAKSVWIALSEKYPEDRPTQWLVLSAPSVQADHDLAGQTIERLRKIIGENDFSFKLARARWLLSSQRPGDTAVAEATNLLSDMSKSSPDVLAPHLLLAGCLEQSENVSGAIDQLEIAATLAPDSAPISIELARLLQNQGNMERAGIFINKVLEHSDLNDTERRQCSGLLMRQGQPDRAITLLEAGIKTGGETETVKLILAGLYAQRGQTQQAGALFDELMKQPNLEVVRLAAAFYASHDRLGDARQAMAQLGQLKLEPAAMATEQGDFEARFGKPEDAIAAYEKALQTAPKDLQIWYRLIGDYLQAGKSKEAGKTIERALAQVSGDKILASLQKNKHHIDALDGDVRSRAILLSLINSPQLVEATEAALARLDPPSGPAVPDALLATDISRLADRYPQDGPLQNLAVDLDVSQNKIEDAVTIATRAMQTFRASPEPARLAAAAFAAANNWSGVLDASTQWRSRSADQTLAPDVMIGMSYLGMGRPDDTLRQIAPYMAEAATDPQRYEGVIVLYAQSELRKNQAANAEAKLWPLAKASKRGLAAFMEVAGRNAPPEVGIRWLNMARGELKGDMDLELMYVSAAAELSKRSGDAKLMATARDDMEKLLASAKDDPAKLSKGYFAIGMIEEAQSAPDSGEASYRRAVELDPKSAGACNNLAMVLARRGALQEALTYGNQAVALLPNDARLQDTLAFVQDKAGDRANAIEHLRVAMQLQPGNPEWRINLAQAYFHAKDYVKAHSTLMNSDGSPYRPAGLGHELQDRLALLQQQLLSVKQ